MLGIVLKSLWWAMATRVIFVAEQDKLLEQLKSFLANGSYQIFFCSVDSPPKKILQLHPDVVVIEVSRDSSILCSSLGEALYAQSAVPLIYLSECFEQDFLEQVVKTEPYALLQLPLRPEEFQAALYLALFRRQSDQQRLQREESYRLFVDNFFGIAYRGTLEFQPLFFHGRVEAITGHRPEDFLSGRLTWAEIIHPDDLRGVITADAEKLCKIPNFATEREYRIIRKDGSVCWVNEQIANIVDQRGRPMAVQGAIRDITSRKNAEAALKRLHLDLEDQVRARTAELLAANETLKETQRQQRALLNSIPDIAWLKDRESLFIAVNEPFAAASSHTPEELVGKSDLDVWPRELAEQYRADDRSVIKGRVMKRVEEPFVNSKGEERLIETIKVPIFNDQNEVVGTAGIARDITERKYAESILRQSHTELERMVEERTAELQVAAEEMQDEIRERRHIEEALRESEERLTLVLEGSGHGFWDWNIETGEVEYSTSWAEIFGFELSEIRGDIRFWEERVHPEDLADVRKKILAHLAGRSERFLAEFRGQTKDGSWKWLVSRGKVVASNLRGRPLRAAGTLTDISERKTAENLLHLTQFAVDSAADGIVWIDRKARICYVNEAKCRSLCYTRAELLSMTIPDIDPGFPPEAWAAHWQDIRQRGSVIIETVNRSKNGTLIPVEVNLNYFDYEGKEYIIAFSRDITERKLVEEALRAEKERLAVTLESIGDGVITTDRAGRVQLLNRVAAELTGWSQEEARERALGEIFKLLEIGSKEPYENPAKRVLRELETQRLPQYTILTSKEGVERIIADSAAPIRDSSGAVIGVVVVFRDVTAEMHLQEELQRAAKLEVIGTLAGGIAHDFNNLLSAIAGNVSLLERELSGEKKGLALIKNIESASMRARDLTQQLLTFALGGAPIKRIIAVDSVVREAVRFIFTGTQHLCEFSKAEKLWPAELDEGQISQVVNNLLLNACQAMRKSGVVKIRLDNVALSADSKLPLPAGPYIKIEITDQGEGIAAENLPKIWDPFFTTKERGSGLGLASAYSIVKAHEGYLEVSSTIGVGSTFSVYLPANPDAVVEKAKEKVIAPSVGVKVLVMDDEELLRDVLGQMLSRLGHDVTCVSDGKQAIEVFEHAYERGERFQLAILDLTIPGGFGGKEVIEKLRQIDPEITAVASSGYSTDPIMADFSRYGFDGRLVKPYRLKDLEEAISNVFAERPQRLH